MKLSLQGMLTIRTLPEHTGISDDLDVLMNALAPDPGMNWISISSFGAGEAALSLAASGADKVTAYDIEDAQILRRLIVLKTTAAAVLEHNDYLTLMGLRLAPHSRRQVIIRRTMESLSGADYRFWAKYIHGFTPGLFFLNKQTFFLQLFLGLIRLSAPARARRQILFSPSADTRIKLFRRYVPRPWLKYLFDRLGSRVNFFYPESEWRNSDYPKVFNRNPFPYFEHLIGTGLTCNPMFAHYFLNGSTTLPESLLPPHLRPQGYRGLCTAGDRIQVFPSSSKFRRLMHLAAQSYHGAYLSNIIDYLDPDDRNLLCRAISRVLIPGAPVLIYSSESYDKVPPECGLEPDHAASARLAAQDRVRAYARVGLYRVAA